MKIDQRYLVLVEYKKALDSYLSESLSEADTRVKFIDVFLNDILGWREEDMRRERTFWTEEKRAATDYEVGRPRPLFLVEAKRLRIDFELPNSSGRHLYRLDGVIESCPSLWDVIVQARKYCDESGIPVALVTNGVHFALFRAVTLNKSWREGNAFVASVDTLLGKHFASFHDALSAETSNVVCIDQLLENTSISTKGVRVGDTLGTQVGRLSNRLSDVMEQTIGVVLRDQPEPSREFLAQCYSADPSLDYYAKSLQGLLRDPIPIFSSEVGSVRPGHKKDPFGRALSALMDRQGIRPPIIIIGGKGFGKTTFLQWFMKASKFHEELESQIVLWIDFRPAGYSHAAVEQEVRRQLIEQLENSSALSLNTFGGMKQVFKDRIELEKKRFLAPFARDPDEVEKKTAELIQEWRKDAQGYLLALVHYAVSHCHKRVVIVLDNSDQKAIDFQIQAYNTAQQLASALPATVIISLRESTFYRLCKMPQGDAFSQQQVFHIRAPNIPSVLKQRFDFLATELARTKISVRSASGVDMTVTNIEQFVRLLQRSLLEGRDAPLITELLAAISNGSIREALNLIHEFLVSGHTKMEDYVWQYAINATSMIPFHEFIASVMLDEMAYFREEYSHSFINLFSRSAATGDSHFTRLRLLHLIRAVSPGNEFRPDDYVGLSTIKARMLTIGVPDASIDAHLQTLIRFGLLQADTLTTLDEPGSVTREFEKVSAVHIAAAGQYYLDTLCGTFQYLQRIIPDVPINDKSEFDTLHDLFAPFRSKPVVMPVAKAVTAVETLVRYLGSQEAGELDEGVVSRDPLLRSVRFVGTMEKQLAPQLSAIHRWIDKAKEGPNNGVEPIR